MEKLGTFIGSNKYWLLSLLLLIGAVIFIVITLVFFLIHMVPGDPVQQMLGEGARAGDVEQMRRALGLDLPLSAQYRNYLAGLFRGDLGTSFRFSSLFKWLSGPQIDAHDRRKLELDNLQPSMENRLAKSILQR